MRFKEWNKKKLGEIAVIQTGPFGSQLHVSDYTEVGIPVIMPVNIENGRVNTEKIARVSQQTADSLARHKVEVNDIVFSRRGDVERHAFMRSENIGWLCGTGCLKVSFKSNVVHPRFVSYQLLLPEKKAWLRNHAVGTTMPNLNTSILSELEIDLPNLESQYRISAILSSIDDKIELNRQTNQTLEAIAQTLFKEWFVDFNFPGATGEMQESELGKIPKGWKVAKLESVLTVKGGTTPSTKNPEYWNGEYYWATPKDLSTLRSPVLLNTERKITEKGVKQISSGILPKGTLLLSSRAPIGYLAIADVPVSINQGFIAINGTVLSNVFLLFWLKENMEKVTSRANGSTFLEISKSSFREIEIVIPSAEIANAYDKVAKPLFDQIKSNEEQTQTLIELRDTLLPKLMKGEIPIHQAEPLLTAAV